MKTREHGLSLVEISVAITITAVVLLMVQDLFGTTMSAQNLVASRDRAAQQCGRLLSDLRAVGLSSRRVYQDDATGRAYLAAITTADFPILGDARLPVIDPAGRLEPDAVGARRTGNVVLLAVEDRPMDVRGTSARHRIDAVRFVVVYPTRRTGRVVGAIADRIDLVRVTSRPYADRASIDQITDATERASVVQALHAAGVTRAWVASATIDQAFFELNASGTIGATPVEAPTLDPLAIDPPRPLLGEAKSTVAPNSAGARVPAFARLDNTIPEFPGGFEVKVVGQSGGRQVLIRLTILAGTHAGPDATATTLRIFSVRDP